MKNDYDLQKKLIKDYWVEKLTQDITSSIVPKPGPKAPAESSTETLEFPLPESAITPITTMSKNNPVTEFIISLSIWGILLNKYVNIQKILVASPGLRENQNPNKECMLFYNIEISQESTLKEILSRTRTEVLESVSHNGYDYNELKIAIAGKLPDSNPVFRYGMRDSRVHGNSNEFNKVNLQFHLEEGDGQKKQLIIKYENHHFESAFVRQLASHYIFLLEKIRSNLDKIVSEIDMLTQEEKRHILEDLNEKPSENIQRNTIIDIFQEQVNARPDKTAVQYNNTQITYHTLAEKSGQLAGKLREIGVKPDAIVGIKIKRSIEMIIGIFGILKSGGTYLPIDPEYPKERISFMLKDSGATRMITLNTGMQENKSGTEMIVNEQLVISDLTPKNIKKRTQTDNIGKSNLNTTSSNLAYIIYTSGSTGKPKGVMVEHRNVVTLLFNEKFPFEFGEEDTWTLFHSICFDFSVWELFGALLYGGKSIVVPLEAARTPHVFANLLEKNRVTVLNQVPTMFYNLTQELLKSPDQGTEKLHLKYVIFGGEALDPNRLKSWHDVNPAVKLVNMYGITETTVHVTYKEIGDNEISIGKSCIGEPLHSWSTCHILDNQLNPVPFKIPGEIVVGGNGVARGYLNRVELTQDRFVSIGSNPENRLYRSGDSGQREFNGEIEYLGRIDEQVKIRGFRIEIGEIEKCILELPTVTDAKVVAGVDKDNNRFLAAYIADTTTETSDTQYRQHMGKRLPEYMIPQYFIRLDKLPVTPSGKVDKKALPPPGVYRSGEKPYEAPVNEIESLLTVIWEEVLGINKISVHENFFTLGGDSIKGIHVVNKIQQWLQEIIHVSVIFEAPTIRELAQKLESYRKDDSSIVDSEKLRQFRQIIPPQPSFNRKTAKYPPAVFILSPPRSGSTLLRVILAGHPKLFAPPELELLSFNTLGDRRHELSGRYAYFAEGAVRAIMELKGCDAEQAQALMTEFENSDLTIQQFYGILQEWLKNERLLVDKTPFYTLKPETLKRAEEYFDAPRYIHLLRSPQASIHSFIEAKLDQIFRYPNTFTVRELAELIWIACNQNIVEFLDTLPQERKLALKFEDLLQEPEKITRQICEFLGIDFHPGMLSVYAEKKGKMIDGIHPESKMLGDIKFLQHNGIDRNVAERWKKRFSEENLSSITRELAEHLGYSKKQTGQKYTGIVPIAGRNHYRLSHAQKRMWLLEQFNAKHSAYNISGVYRLEGTIDRTALEKSFCNVIQRHESLRTIFKQEKGEPIQLIRDYEDLKFQMEYIQLELNQHKDKSARSLINHKVIESFQLDHGLLLRAGLIRLEECVHILYFIMPHIISDGWSVGLFLKELITFYQENKKRKTEPQSLTPLQIQYKDFCEWQGSNITEEILNKQERFWLNSFEGEIPLLKIPTDYPRPNFQSFKGDIVNFRLEPSEIAPIKALCQQENLTLFMTLFSAASIFLSIISGQEDLVIGTPIAGRNHEDLNPVIGMFVNTLALRVQPIGHKTLKHYLDENRQHVLHAFENQDYPFETLVEKLTVKRDVSRNPVFDVAFALQGSFLNPSEIPDLQDTGLNITPFEYENRIAKFDLGIYGSEADEGMIFSIEYCSDLFKRETIEGYANYLKRIITTIGREAIQKLAEIEIITTEEKQQILYDFNHTAREYPRNETIHHLFEEQAEQIPDNMAVIYPPLQLTYRQLNEQSDRLSEGLREQGVEIDRIVCLKMERSMEMIVGILGVLKAGGAYLPIDPEYPQERIDYMIKDSRSDILLTTTQLEEIITNDNKPLKPCISPGNRLAYVMYTSGSTGQPKGVMVMHRNVVRLVKNSNFVDFSANMRVLQTGAPVFDAVTFEMWGPLLNGGQLFLVDKDTILDAFSLGRELKNHCINTLWLSSPLFNQLMQLNSGIFSTLENLIVGGDVLSPTYINEVRNRNKQLKVVNGYGPTENTTFSVCHWIEHNYEQSIPIGKPIANSTAFIVDQYHRLQPVGIPGELYVGGDGISRGYLNNPELTAEKFCYRHPKIQEGAFWKELSLIPPQSNNSNPHSPTHPLTYSTVYRTGDLARWKPEGVIEFIGRIDHQVKIRGFRVELGEIENHILHIEGIKEAIVRANEEETGDKNLYAYFVSTGQLDPTELQKQLKKILPEYMVPSYFIKLEKFPLTANGKINWRALPKPELKQDESYIPPRNEIEKTLVNLWAEVLGRDELHTSQLKTSIGIHDDFFQLGGHSLKATTLMSKIHKELEVKIELVNIFQTPTIEEIAQLIQGLKKEAFHTITPLEKKEYYPMSSAQKRLYFLQQLDLNSVGYNMPMALPLEHKLDADKLETILKALIIRHESLRTSMERVNEDVIQRIHPAENIKFSLDRFEAGAEESEEILRHYIRPFDLSHAPLIRSGLISHPEGHCTWIVDVHHIVSDGTSHNVLTEDFIQLYNTDTPLNPLRVQYKDFTQWQNQLFSSEIIKSQEAYWQELYKGEIPKLDLVADYKRPKVFTFKGDHYRFWLDSEDAIKFKALGARYGGTLYMNILAVLNTLFYKYTDQTDVIIGSGIAGRRHADIQGVVGMFVNTLALRNYPTGNKTYENFLKEVSANSVNAFENQDVQFEDLVDRLQLQREASRNPLFDVSMVVQNFKTISEGEANDQKRNMQLEIQKLHSSGFRNKTSKFDLTFFILEIADDIYINLEYYTGIFKEETIYRLETHFKNIIKAIINQPSIPLKDIQFMSSEEKRQVLHEFNNTMSQYPKDQTIHGVFEEQADRIPDRIALIYENHSISFRKLDKNANQLAHYLHSAKRLQPETFVGILLDRSLEQIIAILGVLKAGGGYLPLDSSLPETRIKNMITDAQLPVVLSSGKFIRNLNKLQWECKSFNSFLCLDSTNVYLEEESEKSGLMDENLWDYVANSATDEITGGGWFNSYDGDAFSSQEMAEYGDNILQKLTPLFHEKMKILEIGCGSGISMYRIAPKIGAYYATDLSKGIIENNKKRVHQEGYNNIFLYQLAAHEIDRLDEQNFDMVIINSVIQSFHGLNYLRKVIEKSIEKLTENGYLFIGDILDQELKESIIAEMTDFKYNNERGSSKTKIDWSADLFVSKSFFEDLSIDIPAIQQVKFSNKIYTIENELTKFRYDTLLTINKNQYGETPGKSTKVKQKHQEDINTLRNFPTEKLTIQISAGTPAYVIYTSGSTGKPKGVVVEHHNVIRLVKNTNYIGHINFTDRDRFLLTGAFAFDISTFEIWGMLLNGLSILMVERNVLLDLDRLKQAIDKKQISIIHFTPQLFVEIVAHCPEIFQQIRCLLVGGDVVTPAAVNRLRNRYKQLEILHMYGPTENTTFSTFFPVDKDYESLIPIGKPLSNSTIYIVDRFGQLQPIGIPGELCTGGDGVTRGYLNHPELTAEKFCSLASCKPFSSFYSPTLPLSYSTLYRTGDLARWLSDGNIEFLGRIDKQVKIRGYRIEMQEIENRLLKIEGIKEAIVIDLIDTSKSKYLCAYIISEENIEITGLRDILSKSIPEYMIPSYFIPIKAIPLTPNGKVNRKALPDPEASIIDGNAHSTYVAPRNELEHKLVDIWRDVLSKPNHAIGIDDNFFQLGGHSLKATALVSKIHKELNVKVPLVEVFKNPIIRTMAQYMRGKTEDKFISISPIEKKDYYSLSSAQKRLYILQQMELDSTTYNMPESFILPADSDIDKIEESFKKLISRHESFRTSFTVVNDIPVQRIHDHIQLELEDYENLGDFVRAFDMSRPPLLHVGLTKNNDGFILFIDMHHIISDGISHDIMTKDFWALYQDEILTPLKLQYKDYSEWQNSETELSVKKQQEAYWLEVFKGDIPILNLPTDYPRSDLLSFEGSVVSIEINSKLTSAIKAYVSQKGVTLMILLMSVCKILLSKYTGQDDIVVGTVVSGRQHVDLENIIGFFVNMLAIRSMPTKSKTIDTFLEEMKNAIVNALDNQDYPFEELVSTLHIPRESGRHPLVDFIFVFREWNQFVSSEDNENTDDANQGIDEYSVSHFDLMIRALDKGDTISIYSEYSTNLFKQSTIEDFIKFYVEILKQIVEAPEMTTLKEIDIEVNLLTATLQKIDDDSEDWDLD